MNVTVQSEDATSYTLAWPPVAGAAGFKFTVDGKVSHTSQGNRTTVRVSKTAQSVKVEALGVTDTGTWPTVTPPPPPPPGGRWFSDTSPWNTPIPASAQPVADSSRWISALAASVGGINVNQGAWCPAVYYPPPGTQRQTVQLDNGWRIDGVPIPGNVKPSGDSDAHLCIIDTEQNMAWEFFAWRGSPGAWGAHAGIVFGLGNHGWWDGTYSSGGLSGPWAARASGAALSGGLIRKTEAAAGVIPHALSACAPKGVIGPPVVPARTSDGSGGSGAMPMGSRIQLDPAVNIATLGLSAGEEMIARAMQTYGVYVTDSSSAFAIYAENFAGGSNPGSNPYPPSWGNGLPKVLIERSRIVASPTGVVWDNRATFGQPHK